jgi:hypothetical protein
VKKEKKMELPRREALVNGKWVPAGPDGKPFNAHKHEAMTTERYAMHIADLCELPHAARLLARMVLELTARVAALEAQQHTAPVFPSPEFRNS